MNKLFPIHRIHCRKTINTNLLFLEDVSGFGRHAVDTPVRLAVVITDGDGESSVVGSDDLNVLVLLLAFYQQLLTLAGVASSDGRTGELAWKIIKKLY